MAGHDETSEREPRISKTRMSSAVPGDGLPLAPRAPHAPLSDPQIGFAAPLHTQRTYRLLTMQGLAAPEAANLTAFLVGLHVHRTPWTIDQVNRMLFLRRLYLADGWGDDERRQ